MNFMLPHKIINTRIKDSHCVCVNVWLSRGKLIPYCIPVERLIEIYPCPSKTQYPCVRTMNTVQDDTEAWWQNLVKRLQVNLPLCIDSKTCITIPNDRQWAAAKIQQSKSSRIQPILIQANFWNKAFCSSAASLNNKAIDCMCQPLLLGATWKD